MRIFDDVPRLLRSSADGDDPRRNRSGSEQQDEPGKPEPRTTAEWVTLIISGLMVALLVGAAIYEHVVRDEPPGIRIAVEIALDQAEERNGLTYVPFTVRNSGQAPAESVVVRFEIKQGDETIEESTAEFDFLPNNGSAEGELVTALDLGAHTVRAQVSTVQRP